ncbi:LysR family transcriptional regulator [Neptuniibacter halophilus]|uniref:LysR family transcriptional regulator n=1 Tax=Neptuniibacter halophilus TaxID=651666 RepID=UPI0025741195|nr:LysR family transcriptional regulator [Neptuniibacter halophilus]
MDIDALRSFIAFVDTGSFTRAAKQICRTQSAISMQMKKLEEETSQTLFVREGRNLALTDQGQQLVSYARRILALHDEALGQFSGSGDHPPLTLGCPDDYAESILPDLIELIRQQRPRLNFRVRCDTSSQLRLLLDAGEIDAAILTRAPEAEEGYLLKHDSGIWAHGGYPDLLQQAVLPLVLYEADCKFHSSAVDGLEKQGIHYRLVCRSSSATVLKSLLRKGLGLCAMANSSLSAGLCPVPSGVLPPLPAVDIVLAVAPRPHPLFDSALAAGLSKAYFSGADQSAAA